MDRLATMTTFAKVVKFSSFTAAGEDLGISRALVSRHITDLESHFGVRLINRTTRSVTPTEAGLRYYELCNRVLSEIRSGEETISQIKEEVEGAISILCPKWVGNFDISEALTDFCKGNPKIRIQLNIGEVSSNPYDFLDKGYDLSIQPNRIRDSEVMVKKIGEVNYVLAAAPEYLAIRGEPQNYKGLMEHDCLTQLSEPLWHLMDTEKVSLRVPSRFSSNSFLSLCTAAVGGLGIVMLPRRVAAGDLASGNLKQILPNVALESRPLYAAYAPGGDVPRKVRTLITFLSDWFRARALTPDDPGRVIRIYGETRARTKAG